MKPSPPLDPLGRTIDYLRISVTDQCNERCLYCRPAGYRGWSARPEHLTAAEILDQVAQANMILRPEERRVRNLVFMGMGEPFHNETELYRAIDRLSAREGLDRKSTRLNSSHSSVSRMPSSA